MMMAQAASCGGPPNAYKVVEKSFKRLLGELESKFGRSGQPHGKAKRRRQQQQGSQLLGRLDPNVTLDMLVDPRAVAEKNVKTTTGGLFAHSTLRVPAQECKRVGLTEDCTVLELRHKPGFFVVCNALTQEAQWRWAHTCLSQYSNARHTNLSNLTGTQPDHWRRAVEGNDRRGLSGLRWASLGYHYDWTARKYTHDAISKFPEKLAALCDALARGVGVPGGLHAEAAIVNYYPAHAKGSMGGHVDNAELTMSKPIVSVSLGCSAVFLLGGRTKAEQPLALLLRSGDVVIMGGESRHCYHGVPCIVPKSFSPVADPPAFPTLVGATEDVQKVQETKTDTPEPARAQEDAPEVAGVPQAEWEVVRSFLTENRINVNSRQVQGDSKEERFTAPQSENGADR